MSKAVFNLQIPISKKLESELRQCAEFDDRKLRTYCRRILEFHIEDMKNKGLLDDTQCDSESISPKGETQSTVDEKQEDKSRFDSDRVAISLVDKEETQKKSNPVNGWKR